MKKPDRMNGPAFQKFELPGIRDNPPLTLLALYARGGNWCLLLCASAEGQGRCR